MNRIFYQFLSFYSYFKQSINEIENDVNYIKIELIDNGVGIEDKRNFIVEIREVHLK